MIMKYSKEKIQLVKELHSPVRKNFPRLKVIVKGLDECWQADLIDMKAHSTVNRGFKYILTVIDILSKFGFAQPLKSKEGSEIEKAFVVIFKTGRIPKKIQTDLGTEFYNAKVEALFQKYNIKLYSTYSPLKASIGERFNRTLKSKLYRLFTLKGSYKWVDELANVVAEYNRTKHRTIKIAPEKVDSKIAKKLLKTVFNYSENLNSKRSKFKINDYVRISKYKHLFEKSYTANYTSEIFKIVRIKRTIPHSYFLKDYTNTRVLSAFYEHELLKVKYPDYYLIEKILRKSKGRAYVKWLGIQGPTWIPLKNISQ